MSALVWAPALLAGAGVFLLTVALADGLHDLYRRWALLRGVGGVVRRFRAPRAEGGGENVAPVFGRVLRRPSGVALLAPTVGLTAAALMRDPWLSPYLAALGVAGGLYLALRRFARDRQALADDVLRFLDVYLGLYGVNHAAFAALGMSLDHLPRGPVREAAAEAVRVYATTRDAEGALRAFQRLDDPYARRFALILARAGERGGEEIEALLRDLRERARKRWQTRLTAQGTFMALRVTLNALKAALAVLLLVSGLIPIWRETFTAGTGWRLFFVVLTLVPATAGVYFDRRITLDEEALL